MTVIRTTTSQPGVIDGSLELLEVTSRSLRSEMRGSCGACLLLPGRRRRATARKAWCGHSDRLDTSVSVLRHVSDAQRTDVVAV